MPDIDGMADQLFSALESFVERRFSALTKRCDELEQRLATLPVPQNGKDADEDAIVERVLKAIPVPQNGKDADPEFIKTELARLVAELPKPSNGKDADENAIVSRVLAEMPAPQNGKDADPEFIKAEVAKAIAELPKPADGKDADEDAIVARVVAAIPVPKKGDPGKDADEDAIVERVLKAIPKPKDGKDFDPTEMRIAIAQAVSELPPAKDGESVHPDTVALMVREAVDKFTSGIRLPKDGEPGRDATHVEYLPAIDLAKSYPRGTWAKHAGGTIMAARTTDPVTTTLAAAGWEVMHDGIADFAVEWIDERTCELRVTRTSGEQTVSKQTFAVVLDRGVFKSARETAYERGDSVTWDGQTWIAQQETNDVPGTSKAWRLSVRKGQNGKDAVAPVKPEPVRLR